MSRSVGWVTLKLRCRRIGHYRTKRRPATSRPRLLPLAAWRKVVGIELACAIAAMRDKRGGENGAESGGICAVGSVGRCVGGPAWGGGGCLPLRAGGAPAPPAPEGGGGAGRTGFERLVPVGSHRLLGFHLRPIDVVVFHGSRRDLVLRGASRLDAFSGYPVRT